MTHFEVSPLREVIDRDSSGPEPPRLPLRAFASFDHGPQEEVTAWTVFRSADPGAVEINAAQASSPVAILHRPGQHVVIARFLDRAVPLQLVFPMSSATVDLSGEPRANFIDDEVLRTLETLGLPVSPQADDATFLRRICLDLTGTLPSPTDVAGFLADPSPDKRAECVERLLSSDEFADYWTLRFARLLRIHSLPNDEIGVRVYTAWLRDAIDRAVPLDELTRQLLTATGDTHEVGPANFSRMAKDARDQAERVSEAFLGVRLQCANCHNHPLDRWTQDDYHGLAAIFARIERGREVRLLARGDVTNLRTNQPARPRIPGTRYLPPDQDGRVALAEWLTGSDNRMFARAMVNRLWQALFGRGLVEPVDDLRNTNPATHPGLLTRLADDFVQHGYDLRHTLRLMASSHTYGRSHQTLDGNAHDEAYYSHAAWRPLEPEVLADAIAEVTGVSDTYGNLPAGTRAITVVDPLTPAPSLDILGRCSGRADCAPAAVAIGLPGTLHLMNGELINAKISAENSRLHRALRSGDSVAQIVSEFYVRALGRPPREAERNTWRDQLQQLDGPERTQILEDFVWSLMNCREFVTNH